MANSVATLAGLDSAAFLENTVNATPQPIGANAMMRPALPHLTSAFEAGTKLAAASLQVRAASHAFDAMNVAVILVDARGRIIFVNGLAEAILSRDGGLTADGIHIGGAGAPALRRLRQAIARCASLAAPPPTIAPVEIAARDGGTAFRVTFAPLGRNTIEQHASHAGLSEPVALLLIHDIEQHRRTMRRRLCERFSLTTAEAGVVMEVIEGGGRVGVARRLGVSVATVRTHLIHIFEKTGVRRQAELVRLALDSEPQLGCFRDGRSVPSPSSSSNRCGRSAASQTRRCRWKDRSRPRPPGSDP